MLEDRSRTNTMMTALQERIRSIALTHQFHILGLAMFALFVLVATASQPSKGLQQGLLLCAAFAFALGFSAWCAPAIRKHWAHPLVRMILIILHLGVLILATTLARNVVSVALGLPPQDFELTVNALALAFYIPAWAGVVCILVGIFAFCIYTYGLLVGLFREGFAECVKMFCQALGALAICVFSAATFQFAINHQESLHPYIRWVAYFADFQLAPAYPGVAPNKRVRLHENGVVSSASLEDLEIVVRIHNIAPQEECRGIHN